MARRKGLAATTVRDVAAEMGTSSGLDPPLLRVAWTTSSRRRSSRSPRPTSPGRRRRWRRPTVRVAALAAFFRTYAPADADWAFQLWLDAWAEAARRPALQATSRRLNLAWQGLLETDDRARASRPARSPRRIPAAAAWRILSLLDGLALQVVAHGTTIGRDDVERWAASAAELELGLEPGTLGGERPADLGRGRVRAVAQRLRSRIGRARSGSSTTNANIARSPHRPRNRWP